MFRKLALPLSHSSNPTVLLYFNELIAHGNGISHSLYTLQIYDARARLWMTKGEAQAEVECIEGMKPLEGELGEKPYFSGEAFVFLDITLA